MSIIGHFSITDYDGRVYQYYKFGDAHPCDKGVFQNFPQGNHDFCLETYIRRLGLEQSNCDYIIDVTYIMDLRTRTIQIASKAFTEDINYNGSFEGAIKRFAYEDYSEKNALMDFPDKSKTQKLLSCGLYDVMQTIIESIESNIQYLKYDILTNKICIVGDCMIFYMFKDFVDYPPCRMNRNPKAIDDAYINARRIGVRLYFNNKMTNDYFTLFYMLGITNEGFFLPMTRKFVRFGEDIDNETKNEELKILINIIRSKDPQQLRALNCYYRLLY